VVKSYPNQEKFAVVWGGQVLLPVVLLLLCLLWGALAAIVPD